MPPSSASVPRDIRLASAGLPLLSDVYSDQPYLVSTDDGAWLCAVTVSGAHEGNPGQKVVSLRSTDRGRTWSPLVELEPGETRENSYAVLLKAPRGRIYCFYNFNEANIRTVKADPAVYPGGLCPRVDSVGEFVFRYSEDHGRTWSARRYPVPVRVTAIDRENAYGGKIRFFWNVGRPFLHGGGAYVPLHKVGSIGAGFFSRSEGVLLHSPNLPHESDPAALRWETLPSGEHGLRGPAESGPIHEEHSFTVLSDGTFYVVWRTVDGHPWHARSTDSGRTWGTPARQCFRDGVPMKQPRAANFLWKLANGRYLYWFHNHGGRFIREDPRRLDRGYENRNPAWLCGGVEQDGPAGRTIAWSQPEIFLYDDDPVVRMSYPDLIEDRGEVFISETDKSHARIHPVPAALLEQLWSQFDENGTAPAPVLSLEPMGLSDDLRLPDDFPPLLSGRGANAPFPTDDLRTGFTLEVRKPAGVIWNAGHVILDSRTPEGRGFALSVNDRDELELRLNDGQTDCRWFSDPGVVQTRRPMHAVVIVDGGPKLILFVIDGHLCTGGDQRQFGWGRYSPSLRHVLGEPRLRLPGPVALRPASVRLFDRALLVSEAVTAHRLQATLPSLTAVKTQT